MNKKTLVLGASLKPGRYSNYAIHKLVEEHIEVVAIGNVTGEVAGVKIDTEKLPHEDIHTVTLYLNPKNQIPYYDYIVSLKPKRVIFNPGTENPELYKILKENDINFETACSLVLLSTNQY
ncbi:CoA-binding protein [Aestuariibaculum sp. YM273]|uniref:CoA-binding protein n=1 Tax=Aestuariibaculum sp. YM273 TaxID=3070659 RepID=UPI0027DD0E10|nr:CoA-binding protein [Aestuariibaculum sp. YM273]WMI65867.1 CoA-binding protein [Aestuariibaculum sp. YM273]